MIEEMNSDSDGSLSVEEIDVDASSDGDGKLSDSKLISLMDSIGPPPMGSMNMNQSSGSGGALPDSSELFSTL